MKKILATLIGLAAGATLVNAQGWISLNAEGAGVTTNTAGSAAIYAENPSAYSTGKTFNQGTGGVAYYYTLLYIASGAAASSTDSNNPTSSDWTQLYTDAGGTPGVALTLTNYPGSAAAAAGGLQGNGAANSTQALGSGGQAFNNGTDYQLLLVGWSANLGPSWSTVASDYNSGFAADTGFFGYELATGTGTSGAPGTSLLTLGFPNGSLVLYNVVITPEPTTLALAGLGGLSMLFLRRRKA
jgi:hypothetical protein